jgi:hypothetical protein
MRIANIKMSPKKSKTTTNKNVIVLSLFLFSLESNRRMSAFVMVIYIFAQPIVRVATDATIVRVATDAYNCTCRDRHGSGKKDLLSFAKQTHGDRISNIGIKPNECACPRNTTRLGVCRRRRGTLRYADRCRPWRFCVTCHSGS